MKVELYRAIAKSVAGKYSVYVANLVSLMILARLFTPEVFGVVATIGVFYLFFQLMAEAGLGPAIINIDVLSEKSRDGIFGLTLTMGVILAVIFASFTPIFVWFYEIQEVENVVPFVSVALFFFAASIVPNAQLLRQQAFYKIALTGLLAEVTSTSTTIILMAYVNPLVALASKAAVSAATMAISAWIYSASTEFGRPWPGIQFSAIKPLLGFSGYQFGFNFINYFSRNLDNILVGKYMGVAALGTYEKAYQLMRYPLMLLTFAMTPAIQPVIRQHAYDRVKIEEIHRDFTFKLSLLGLVACTLTFFLSEWIVLVLLGEQWINVIPIIQILALAIPVQVVLATSGSFFQAMGRADLLFLSGAMSACVMVAAITVGIWKKDIELLCWLLVVAFHINFFQAYFFLYLKIFNQNMLNFLYKMIPSAIGVVLLVFIKN
jgi:O-antigen/teichoic acid export membrane protein